jgi:hypothetical protein
MNDDDLWASIEPAEDGYGGGYRTRHVILKRRHASLAFSAHSRPLGDMVAPGRDYVAEGLCSFVGGESWKFIDAIAVGLKEGGAFRELKPLAVRACPWECIYSYSAGDTKLSISYYLLNAPYGGAGVMRARVEGAGQGDAIVFEPFFDIGPVKASEGKSMEAGVSDGALCVSAGDATACARLDGGELRESGHMVKWKYKLGRGERYMADGRIQPVPEYRSVASFYELEARGESPELRFSCGDSVKEAVALLGFRAAGPREDLMLARAMREAVFPRYGGSEAERAVVLRTLGMARFGMDFEGVRCIEAGGLLERGVLSRDQFEGLLHNYHVIKKLNSLECIKNILLASYGLQDRWGRLPARLSREPGRASADATLMAFFLAGAVVRDTGDDGLAVRSAEAFKKFFNGICACDLMPDGPPMVKPYGLVSVSLAHERAYGYKDIGGLKVPGRVSSSWAQELIERGRAEDLKLQKYLLPEVNARWIRCLEAGWLFSRYTRDFQIADRCKMFYYRALDSYKKIFYDVRKGFVNNMVSTDESLLGRRADPAIGSAGVEAAAILGTDVFAARELGSMAMVAKRLLLREKWGLPFGIATMDSEACSYLSDEREHGGAVRAGSTPYILKLLRMTGDHETADRVLEANLRHQMGEGFVFYNGELFSCDHGPVPSRDPVSWPSQWVDPYLKQWQ